jgi:hypothetical protein
LTSVDAVNGDGCGSGYSGGPGDRASDDAASCGSSGAKWHVGLRDVDVVGVDVTVSM